MSPAERPAERVALVSFHSHGDRSFLDDRELAILSGDLRDDGIENDLVVVAFGRDDASDAATEVKLSAALGGHDVVVFERVWSAALVERLRASLPDATFVHCRGEHVLHDPPADYVCEGDLRQTLPRLVEHLRGRTALPPSHVHRRKGAGFAPLPGNALAAPRTRRFAPNLRPVVVNPDALPAARTFSIEGNAGCPYQADARDNPLYAGVEIPEGFGRGCAFCRTGNHYESHAPAETAAMVLEQLRYVRETAPWLDRLVLKDQNPFVYLTEVVETLAAEGRGPLSLMLETRADWFVRSQRRFERALAAAGTAGIRLTPFLVGIESFSQAELDRYNKGTSAAANVEFLEWLWQLAERHGDALDLAQASFGFVLFSPWTTLDDLETNLQAIRRTRFDRLRGRLLLSRARLYPDTALYYLARRDGLLAEEFREGQDTSRRYGYYPAHPWRFLHDDVAHFAALATELVAETGGRDEVRLFDALLAAFRDAADHRAITAGAVLERLGPRDAGGAAGVAASPELTARFSRLIAPLSLSESFAEGWRFEHLGSAPGVLSVRLGHADHDAVDVEIVPRGPGPRFATSRHYTIRHRQRSLTAEQRRAAEAIAAVIAANDR